MFFGRLPASVVSKTMSWSVALSGARVRHVALDALGYGVLRLAERIALELEREVLVDVGYREEVLEDALETQCPRARARLRRSCSSDSKARVWMSRRCGISIPWFELGE